MGYSIYLPKSFLAAGPPLSAEHLHRSMQYPFEAFNYVLKPEPPVPITRKPERGKVDWRHAQ